MEIERFIALDVETANRQRDSLCQIGFVEFENGVEVQSWSTLVNPECEFEDMNIHIHGIKPADVKDSPKIHLILDGLITATAGQFVVHHTDFDRQVIKACLAKHGKPKLKCNWVDSAIIVQRTWEKYQGSGYKLKQLAQDFNLPYKAHDAEADARTAGLVTILALIESKRTLTDWHKELNTWIPSDRQAEIMNRAKR